MRADIYRGAWGTRVDWARTSADANTLKLELSGYLHFFDIGYSILPTIDAIPIVAFEPARLDVVLKSNRRFFGAR